MNKSFFLLFFTVLIVAIALVWWRPGTKPINAFQSPAPQAIGSPAGPNIRPTSAVASKKQLPGGPYEPSDPRWQWMREQEKRDPSWEWKMPVNFYGKVVDEANQAIAGADVSFMWTDLSREGTSTATTVTDSRGMFALTRRTGKFLEVNVKKEGYYQTKEAHLAGFEYADFSAANYSEPNPDNPVIIHLKKRRAGEALTSRSISLEVPSNGKPVMVDLLNGGRVSADGQLEIAAVTNTEKYPPRFFDWSATVSIPNGGLLEDKDEFPFEAPVVGYIPQVQFNYPANAAGWKRGVRRSYYITFGSPQKYGRLEVAIDGGSQHVDVHYWVNPSGSTNLESNDN